MTDSNAGWRLEKDHIVGGYVVYCGDEPVASCPSKKDAAEIVVNANKAQLLDVLLQGNLVLHYARDNRWYLHKLDWDHGGIQSDGCLGSGSTAVKAVEAALRLKGAGS